MTTAYEIPLSPQPQRFSISLGGQDYQLTWRWNVAGGCWNLTVADSLGNALVSNIPVVTGLDLLAPHRHLGIPGAIVVQTDNDPDVVPTLVNLGERGHVYFVP